MATQTPYLDVQNLTKSFGAHVLFENISFSVAERQKVGLVARNGTGKSTLLSILTGIEGYDSGEIIFRRDLRIGYLEQSPKFNPEDTVLDACFNHDGNEEKILKAKQILTQLKISDLSQTMGTLSGGQQRRVALANVLITDPDMFILDEPTNHLDLDMIEWLEGFLSKGNKTLLMVTHDRFFLDRVCSTILELDDKTVYTYRGNYSFYLEKRQERIDNTRAEIARANNLYRKELDWMRRMPQARGHKARYREDAFYELEKVAKQRIEERQVRLKSRNVYIGSKIFECQYISKQWAPDKVVLRDFYYNFARFEKMGIVGNNGTGKSTFVKMLLGLEKPDSGRFDIGTTVKFGYFSQESFIGAECDPSTKAIDYIRSISQEIDTPEGTLTAAQMMEKFLFSSDLQHTEIGRLSGGERRRLYLLRVLMEAPNVLILDEPTNDLDIETLSVLEDYLEEFPGVVIAVSHDRYFLDKLMNHVFVLAGDGVVTHYTGGYTDYRTDVTEQEKLKKAAQKTPARENRDGRNQHEKLKFSFKEQREYEQIDGIIADLEGKIAQTEQEISQSSSDYTALQELTARKEQLETELAEKMERWVYLNDLAERIEEQKNK